jgi:hypothetical protein
MRPILVRHLGAGFLSAVWFFSVLPARSADYDGNLEKSFSVRSGGKLIVQSNTVGRGHDLPTHPKHAHLTSKPQFLQI